MVSFEIQLKNQLSFSYLIFVNNELVKLFFYKKKMNKFTNQYIPSEPKGISHKFSNCAVSANQFITFF